MACGSRSQTSRVASYPRGRRVPAGRGRPRPGWVDQVHGGVRLACVLFSAFCLAACPVALEAAGVIVVAVEEDSPAARAGIEVWDRLLSYGGKPVLSPIWLQAAEENTFGDAQLPVVLQRGRQKLKVSVPSGPLGLRARSDLPSDAMGAYEDGLGALELGRGDRAAARWVLAAQAAQASGGKMQAAWLYHAAGYLCEQREDWQRACESYEAALNLLANAADAAARSSLLSSLGFCASRLEDPVAARRWLEQARDVARAAGYEAWTAKCLFLLGLVAQDQDDLQAARAYLADALSIQDRLLPGSMSLAGTLYLLGTVASALDDRATAYDCYSRALAIQDREAPGSRELAYTLNGLGVLELQRGDLRAARERLTRALQIRERLAPDSLEVATVLANLGSVALDEGDAEAAHQYETRALAIHERLGSASRDVAAILGNLGAVALERGDLDAAQDYCSRALALWQKEAPDSLDVATCLYNLGRVAEKRDDLPAARDHLSRSLALREGLAPDSLLVAATLTYLGWLADRSRDLDAAEDCHTRALAIQERLAPDHVDVAASLSNLGFIALQRERPSDALPLLARAAEIVESHRSQIASPEVRALFTESRHAVYLGLLRSHLALGDLGSAFATLERLRGRALVEMLAEGRAGLRGDVPAELLAKQDALDQARATAYERLTGLDARKDAAQIEELRAQLAAWAVQQRELEAQIRSAAPRYADLQYPAPLDLKAAQAALDPGTLLLAYYMDNNETYLFAVTPGQGVDSGFGGAEVPNADLHEDGVWLFRVARDFVNLNTMILMLESAIARQAGPSRAELATGEEREAAAPERALFFLRDLYDGLVRPAQRLIDRAERLLICPDAWLTRLPFAALVAEEQDGAVRYLADLKPLHTVVSVTAYARLRQAKGHGGLLTTQQPTLVAFGDPEYDTGPAGLALSPLPGTRAEVEAIAALYGPEARAFLGREATKAAALQECREARLVHFACHGILDHRDPLASGIALTATEDDDGLLRAWEILQRARLDADLVVLSACQTGQGQHTRHEGVIGLTRALQYAGARSVMVSLWSVSDASTAALMTAFYRELREGASKDVALQRAMGELRKDPRWEHPFYWAPFVLVGDWQ